MSNRRDGGDRQLALLLPALAATLALAVLLSLSSGRYPLPPLEVLHYLAAAVGAAGMDESRQALIGNLLWDIRAPRIAAALLVGAALSTSGAAYQAVFMNPLVSPGLLGVLAGASFGAALGLLLSKSWLLVQLLAFAGGVAAVALALVLARVQQDRSLLMLILTGIISAAFFTALLSIVKFLADPINQLPTIVHWLMGSLAQTDGAVVARMAAPILAGIAIMLVWCKQLDALAMGEDEARALGVDVPRVRGWVIFGATLSSALTVALAGMVGWIGLVVPHVARLLVGPQSHRLLPASALLGGVFLILVDTGARTLHSAELPLGVLTELIGIPVFVIVLRNAQKAWA